MEGKKSRHTSPTIRTRNLKHPPNLQARHFQRSKTKTPPPSSGSGRNQSDLKDDGRSATGTDQDDDKWESCCMVMEPEAARFFALLLLTVFILGFCFYQLAYGEPCNQAPLWGLIGTMIGFWFDGPKMSPKNKN